MNDSRMVLFGFSHPLVLTTQLFNTEIEGVAKCRIIYSNIIHSIDIQPYSLRQINKLHLVEKNDIDYSHKYVDRSIFQNLTVNAPNEDSLIIKNGHITDTTFSNIVFFDGCHWITPSTYLLNGTQRQRLLKDKRIISQDITVNDLNHFFYARLINAMLDFDSTPVIPITAIK